jgi:hypothetical protein
MAGHDHDRGCRMVGGLAKTTQTQRRFLDFLLSNLLWIVWGWYAHAYALIILQICLAAINIRGAQKNDPAAGPDYPAA